MSWNKWQTSKQKWFKSAQSVLSQKFSHEKNMHCIKFLVQCSLVFLSRRLITFHWCIQSILNGKWKCIYWIAEPGMRSFGKFYRGLCRTLPAWNTALIKVKSISLRRNKSSWWVRLSSFRNSCDLKSQVDYEWITNSLLLEMQFQQRFHRDWMSKIGRFADYHLSIRIDDW